MHAEGGEGAEEEEGEAYGAQERSEAHDRPVGCIDGEMTGQGLGGGVGTRAKNGTGTSEDQTMKRPTVVHGHGVPVKVGMKAVSGSGGGGGGGGGRMGLTVMAGLSNLSVGGGKEKTYKRKKSLKGAMISKTGIAGGLSMTAQLPSKVTY